MINKGGKAPVGYVAENAQNKNDACRFGPLTRPQHAMLALLDDGPEEDSVGLEAEELRSHQIAVCERLVGKDLVRFDIGWRYSCWFRLTPAGREALRELRVIKQAGR